MNYIKYFKLNTPIFSVNNVVRSVLVFVLFIVSCGEEEIRLTELPPYTEKLVVNGMINQSGVQLFLSNSASALSADSVNVIRDADVILSTSVGGPYRLNYDFSIQRFAFDSVFFPPGTNYTLNVNRRGFNPVSSNGTIPSGVSFTADYIPDGGLDTSGFPSDLITVNFTDPRNVRNFYRINFYEHDPLFNNFRQMYFELNHPGLNSRNSLVLRDGSVLFNDELMDGRNVEFSFVPIFGSGEGNTEYKYLVEFESVSEDLYRYYITIDRARQAGNGGFNFGSTPVIVHTNIVNGLGIFGASNLMRDTLRVK